jgi:hypothetical protein
MWKLVQRPRYSFSGNICFKFSAFFLCSEITHAVVAGGEHLHVGLAVGPDRPAHRLRVAPVSWAAANRFLTYSQVPPAHLLNAESCKTHFFVLINGSHEDLPFLA